MQDEEMLDPMSEEDDDEVIVLSDDEGNDSTFRVQGRMEVNGHRYMILEDLEDEGSVLIFSLETGDDGEDVLNPVEDEDECQLVYDYFIADMDDYEFCDAE